MTMKSLSDAIHLRNRLVDMLEEADFECAAGSRPILLTIVVADGGFSEDGSCKKKKFTQFLTQFQASHSYHTDL
jgi:hypothetical protein